MIGARHNDTDRRISFGDPPRITGFINYSLMMTGDFVDAIGCDQVMSDHPGMGFWWGWEVGMGGGDGCGVGMRH